MIVGSYESQKQKSVHSVTPPRPLDHAGSLEAPRLEVFTMKCIRNE